VIGIFVLGTLVDCNCVSVPGDIPNGSNVDDNKTEMVSTIKQVI
jgi:hypothetical protein